jgi:zinc transporter
MSGFGYRVEKGQAERVPLRHILRCEAPLVWAHLTATTEHAQAWLRDEAQLDTYVVDALTATETRPRCDALQDGALVNLRGRSQDAPNTGDVLASVRIWASQGRIFSVARRHLVALDQVEAMVQKGEINDPGDLISAFATAITADLDPDVADLGDALDNAEEQISADNIFALRREVTRVRVAALGYRRFLQPQRAALEKLAALPCDWLQDDDRLHLNAAADRAARMAEELESIRERSAVMHETLTDLRAEQIDARGLVLSAAALIFLPLTFITGLYGMNVQGLPGADSPHAFTWITLGCLGIAAGVIAWFVLRWFKR